MPWLGWLASSKVVDRLAHRLLPSEIMEIKNAKTRASAGGKARAAALSEKDRAKLGKKLAKARAARRTPERIAEIGRNIRLALARKKLGLNQVVPVQVIQPGAAALQMCRAKKCYGILIELFCLADLERISAELAEHLADCGNAGRVWVLFCFTTEAHARTALAKLPHNTISIDADVTLVGPAGEVLERIVYQRWSR